LKRFAQIRNGKKRWFKRVEYPYDVHKDTGVISPLKSLQAEDRASEIIWFVNYTPRSDYYGLPDIIPALGAIWGDIARRDYNIAFFDNYGVPAYAIFVSGNFDPGEVDEEGRTEMEKMIEEHFAELAKNPHSTLILSVPTEGRDEEVKIEFKSLSAEIKEASFRLYRNDNRDEILSAHGMPPYRIGVNETGLVRRIHGCREHRNLQDVGDRTEAGDAGSGYKPLYYLERVPGRRLGVQTRGD